MLLESLETIPFIIVTVINLLSVNKAIYRLLNHKRIFDSSDDITFRFYVYPYVFYGLCFSAEQTIYGKSSWQYRKYLHLLYCQRLFLCGKMLQNRLTSLINLIVAD